MKPKPKQKITVPLAIDSGAHTFYSKFAAPRDNKGRILRGANVVDRADHSYSTTDKFAQYLDSYIQFIKESGEHLEFCVSLDVPLNAKRSWELYVEMQRRGVSVLPVYHYGEDIKYLKRYMDSTDYIGIGGLVNTGDKLSSHYFRERTWKILRDDKGRPLVKVHAFGMASFELMRKHPYYSVDSTTAFTWSRYGCLMVPKKNPISHEFDYSSSPIIYACTPGRSKAKNHVDHLHPGGRTIRIIHEYCEQVGILLDQAREDYGARDTANMFFMNSTMTAITDHHSKTCGTYSPMIYYTSGNFTESLKKYLTSMRQLTDSGNRKYLAYLGTYAALGPLAKLAKATINVTLETA